MPALAHFQQILEDPHSIATSSKSRLRLPGKPGQTARPDQRDLSSRSLRVQRRSSDCAGIAKTAQLAFSQYPRGAAGIVRSTDRMKQPSTTPNTDNRDGLEEVDCERILRIVEKHNRDRGGLIAILEEIQAGWGYLPEKALRIVSERKGYSLVDLYGVATFYRSFSLRPRGRHLVCACLGTACHVRGAPTIAQEIEQQLGIKAGETTGDREFTLETVNCLGACALGPVVVIDGHYFSKVRKSRVRHLLEQAVTGFDRLETGTDRRIFPLEVNCSHCNHSLKDETFTIDGYPSIRVIISSDHTQGWLRLSCLYGSCNSVSEFDVPAGSAVGFRCPHCGVEFPSTSDCPMCGAPMVLMLVDGGGIVQICSRAGCRHHLLDLV